MDLWEQQLWTKSSTFHQCYQHIVSTCPKIDISVVIPPDLDFDAPFPSRDVDGGDVSKFSSVSNFLSYIHSATTKDHETHDPGLNNNGICGNVGMNVIETDEVVCDAGMNVIEADDLKVCTAMEQQILDDNIIEADDLKACTAMEQQIFDDNVFGHELNYNCEIELNQSGDFDSKSIDSSHDGQSCNNSIAATAWSAHHPAVCDENENSDPTYITMTHVGDENSNSAYTTTCDANENSDPAYTTTTCDGNEILLTVPACANCGNDGDTVGNHANPLDLQCYICNVNNDSNTDKTSDDVDTFDDDTIYDDVPPALSSSLDVDIDECKG